MQQICTIDHGGPTVPAARIRIVPLQRVIRLVPLAPPPRPEPEPDPGPIDNRHARRRAAALERTRRKRLQRLLAAVQALASALFLGTAVGCGPVDDEPWTAPQPNPVWTILFPDQPVMWTLP